MASSDWGKVGGVTVECHQTTREDRQTQRERAESMTINQLTAHAKNVEGGVHTDMGDDDCYRHKRLHHPLLLFTVKQEGEHAAAVKPRKSHRY
jgi:hypothetical protein